MLTKLIELLSSLKFSIFLTLSGAIYYLFLAIWGFKSPSFVIQNIAKLLPYKLFYLFLILNNLFCIIRRLSKLNQEYKGKDKISFLGTSLFHFSLIFLALGFFLSVNSHYEGKFLLGEEEETIIKKEDISTSAPPPLLFNEFPEFKIKLEKVIYKFWEDKLLFTELLGYGKIEEKNFSIKINKFYILNFFNFLRISSFGYAPSYMVLIENYPKPIEEGILKIFLFPPGRKELFITQHFPHKFYITLYPDFIEKDGNFYSKSMELKNPKLLVKAYRGKVFLKEKILSLREPFEVENLTLGFLDIYPILEISIVQDKGFFLVIFSILLGVLSFTIRMYFKKEK